MRAFAGRTAVGGGCRVRFEVPKHFAPGLHRAYLSTPGNKQFLPSRTDFVINAVKPRHSE